MTGKLLSSFIAYNLFSLTNCFKDLKYLHADESNNEMNKYFEIPKEFQPNPTHIKAVSVEGVRKVKTLAQSIFRRKKN